MSWTFSSTTMTFSQPGYTFSGLTPSDTPTSNYLLMLMGIS